MAQQMPLFPAEPQTAEEISRKTPIQATIRLFLAYLRREGKSTNTITSFESDLKLTLSHIDGATPVGSITTKDLDDFLHWLEHDRVDESGQRIPCSRKSYARRVTTLKVYFKWLKGLKAIPSDPAEAVRQRSGPAPLSDVLSFSDIQTCITAARAYKKGGGQDYRPEMLFRLLIDTGMKKSEVMRLVPPDIDRSNPRNPILTVRHKARNVYRERRIDLEPDWVTLLDLYREQYPPKAGMQEVITCTARNLEYILTDIGEAAGIPFKLSFEVMRWSSAVRDYRLGMDDRSLREKLGLSEASWQESFTKIKQLAARLSHPDAT